MALEPLAPIQPESKTEYVCPMHSRIVRSEPGNCPICGMTREPRVVSAAEEKSPELAAMTRRFWISVAPAIPLIAIEMSDMIPGWPVARVMPASIRTWLELVLATPVVLWAGSPLFVRGWQSIVNRSLNMFTLIGMGIGVAYGYSLFAAVFPYLFPYSFRAADVPCRFTSRPPPRSPRWYCSARCSRCALAAIPAAQSERSWDWRQRPPA
jgi:Cu+-exporting ATPase